MSADVRVGISVIVSEICAIHLIFRGITEMLASPLSSSLMILFGVVLLFLNFQVANQHFLWKRELKRGTGLRGFRAGQFNAVGRVYSPLYVSNMLRNERPLPETGTTMLKHLKAGDVWRDDQNRLRIALSEGKSAIIEDTPAPVNRNGDVFEWGQLGITIGMHPVPVPIRNWPIMESMGIESTRRTGRSIFSIGFSVDPALRGADRTQVQIMQTPVEQEQAEEQEETERQPNEPDSNSQNRKGFSSPIEDLEI